MAAEEAVVSALESPAAERALTRALRERRGRALAGPGDRQPDGRARLGAAACQRRDPEDGRADRQGARDPAGDRLPGRRPDRRRRRPDRAGRPPPRRGARARRAGDLPPASPRGRATAGGPGNARAGVPARRGDHQLRLLRGLGADRVRDQRPLRPRRRCRCAGDRLRRVRLGDRRKRVPGHLLEPLGRDAGDALPRPAPRGARRPAARATAGDAAAGGNGARGAAARPRVRADPLQRAAARLERPLLRHRGPLPATAARGALERLAP